MEKRIHRIMEDPLYIVKANKKSWNCEERNRMIKRRHLLVILKSTFCKMYLPERCKLSVNFFCYKHFRPFLDSFHVVNPLSSELSNDIYISESCKKKSMVSGKVEYQQRASRRPCQLELFPILRGRYHIIYKILSLTSYFVLVNKSKVQYIWHVH